MDNILCWNVRGAGGNKFKSDIYDLVKINKVSILIICEPRVQFDPHKKDLFKLGFNMAEVSEADVFKGGIWILWDKNVVNISPIDSTFQAITVKVCNIGGQPWLLTAVYASPCNKFRSTLWDHLDTIPGRHQLPWFITGDFNETISATDKKGGSLTRRFTGLKKWVERSAVIDMGFQGPAYTWTNNTVKERIDRCFCDSDWRLLFAEAKVFHLARMSSDHCPLLIKLLPQVLLPKTNPPFRFHAMWMQHNSYGDLVSDNWNSSIGDVMSKSADLAITLRSWNKTTFGNIFYQKKQLLARINGIQKALCLRDNPYLVDLETSLMQEYQDIRDKEAIFWKQKSREKWIQEGDRNTKFFHITTMVRRRRNKIDGLFNEHGVWCEDPTVLKSIAANYFQQLFSVTEDNDLRFIIPFMFPDIDQVSLVNLQNEVHPDEVKSAMFHIGGLKSPGFDGFPAQFFQKHWNLVGSDVIDIVTKAFRDGKIPHGLNHTLITLVPKTSSPQHMHLFRPISLCSTIYKVISKIIVARLRPLLGDLVSPNQVSYVPGRQISDNIMLAQELLHKCKRSKGNKGFMIWKVDLSKAYDKLSWTFIEQVLYELKLPENLIKLIMSCVTSTSFQVMLNGDLSDSFMAKRGIRQGDPLSPYLFVLCMEKLSHLICSAVDVKKWKPFCASQSGPAVSHLFFADDLVLFSEASISQATILKKCMDTFCGLSGQSVNFDKSVIYCSPNIRRRDARRISRVCGSPLTNDLGKYLGMPMIHSRVTKHTYANLVDKVQGRLASWKSKHLSMAGRLTLIQAVTSSVPTYAMQTTKLPAQICDSLDRLNRNFLWGDTNDKKKVHLVKWEKVCKPKCKGGLGIKLSADMNKAMLAKASWRITQGDNGL